MYHSSEQRGDRTNGRKRSEEKRRDDFREWLSDNLRYFLLAFIILLIIGAAVVGISIYGKLVKNDSGKQRETVKQTEALKVTENGTEKQPVKQTEPPKESESQPEKQTETEAPAETETLTEAPTEPETEPQTEAPTEPETEPQPVYLTMQGSCYLRAEPSMEAEIIGEYWAGTTVQFLEDVGGWYKVYIDGMTGYMGARFF